MTTPIDIEAAEKRLREAMQQSPADFALDCFPVIRSLVAQLRDARAEVGRLQGMLVGNMQAAQDGYDIEDRLSEALAYYAKADTYAVPHGASDHPPIMADRGKIAHAALSGGGRSLTPIEGTGG